MTHTYLWLIKNEKITAAEVTQGSIVFFHIDRWNGSHQVTVLSVEKDEKKVTLVTDRGKHILSPTTPVWVREYETRQGLNIHFYVSVFTSEPGVWKQFNSQDMNKVNLFMENKKNYPENATFHLEAIQKGFVIAGHRDTVDKWQKQRYHWYEDGYSENPAW